MISSTDKFEEQAQYYSDIMDAIVEYKDNISAVVFWGTTDDQSWRASKYPLLFNEDYTAKPAFDAIVDGIDYTTPEPTDPPTTEPLPTDPEPTETASEGEEVIYGDVDGNGTVDIADVLTINQHLLGLDVTIHSKNADVDSNGKVNDADALNILKSLVDLVTLPVTE